MKKGLTIPFSSIAKSHWLILSKCLFHVLPHSYSFFFFFLFTATPTAHGIRHRAVPRLEVELELQMPATAIATEGSELCVQPSHSSQQHWIPHPLRMARDQTRVLMGTSRIHFHCATTGTPLIPTLNHQEACHPVPRQL